MTDSPLLLPLGLRLRTRQLVTAYVNHSKSTNLWITQINSEEVNKKGPHPSVKAFSFRSENEAKETAYVNAPPKMIPFDMVSHCFGCEGKFNTVFRRPSHCRNCGVCICASCSTAWSKAMVPETYNYKNARTIKICNSCDFISTKFRHALMSGDFKAAKRIYMTGNINLRCPFSNIKRGNEVMLPIHCAVAGGSLELVIWMSEIHHCPFKMINTGNNKQITSSLISTSKGRNVVDIALDHRRIEVLKYLVNQRKLPLQQGKGEKQNPMYDALQLLLRTQTEEQFEASSPLTTSRMPMTNMISMSPRTPSFKKNVVRVRTSGPYTPTQNRTFSFSTPSPNHQVGPPELPFQAKTLRRMTLKSSSSTAGKSSSKQENLSQQQTEKKSHRISKTSASNVYRRSRPGSLNTAIPNYRIAVKSSNSTASETSSEQENLSQQQTEKKSNRIPKKLISNAYRRSRPGSLKTAIPNYCITDTAEDDLDDPDIDNTEQSFDDDESVATTVEDICIICYDQPIDCVFTPCGHQISCLKCSSNLSKCPICSVRASVLKIFRP